jgi:hypothetical protein
MRTDLARPLMPSMEKEGVAPTNNHVERILRIGVLWRKRSPGYRR